MSQNKFAALVGVSRQYVGRLVAAGKIRSNPDKSIPMPEGLHDFNALRLDTPATEQPVPQVATKGAVAATRSRTLGPIEGTTLELRRAQIEEKRNRARLLELEFERESGQLVPREEVIADARRTAAAIRERLNALPSRCALVIEAIVARGGVPRAAEIEAILTDEINLVLSALHGMRFEDAPQAPESSAKVAAQ